ncbi:MAG: fibronectin type III domain-containing protein [Armatimonadetes bacterium]|nr:fibronectin type III domain-containing protein [Armatimonadota bacterium]
MIRLRCHRLGRALSFTLVAALLFGIVVPRGLVLCPRAAAQMDTKTVLAFPAVDESDEGNLEEVAARVSSALALAGQASKSLDLEVFSPSSPMVRRALADGSLRTADVEAPKDAANALIIGQAFRVDTVVLLSVQSLKVGGDPREAEIAVMGTEYDVATNVDADTGAIVAEPKGNTFGVSGQAKARQAKAGDDAGLIRLAAKNAADKIVGVLSGQTAQTFEKEGVGPRKRSNTWRWLAIAIIVGALAAATIGSGGDDPGPPVDETIPTRCSARATTDGIRLTWAPPTTIAKTIFKYEIQRSADGGVFVRIDNDKLGPSADRFTDFNIVTGTAYVYQIRVLYTDGTSSIWVTFNQVVAP